MYPGARHQSTALLILTFIILGSVAGCAVSKSAPTFVSFSEPPSPANYARLYIFRKYAEPTAFQPTVYIDGYEIASFPQEGFTFVALSPTTHHIESTWPMFSGVPKVKFDAQFEPSKTYFLEITGTARVTGFYGPLITVTTTTRVMNVPETSARQPVPARTGLVDEHQRRSLGLELADQFVDVALPRADRAEGEDLGPALLGGIGDGDRVLVDIETDVEGFARLFHG